MNFRLTAILLGIVIVLVAGMLIAVSLDDTPAGDAPLLTSLGKVAADDVDTVELVRTEPTEQKLVFVRVDKDKWEAREPAGPKVEGFQVSNLVRELVSLKPTPFPELPGSPTDAGLNPATLKITLKSGADKAATLLVGDTTTGKDKAVTFVATDNRPGVPVAVRRSDLDAVFKSGTGSGKAWQLAKWLSDYRQRRPFGDLRDPVADLKTVTVTQGKKQLGLSRTDAGDWTFTAPVNYGLADVAGAPDAKPDEFTGVRPLLTFLTGLSATGPEDFIESPGPLDTYGLKADDPNLIRVELTPKTGSPDVLLIGKKVDDKAAPGKVYAKAPNDPAVMKLPADRLDALVKTVADPNDMRDRTLVPETKKEQIDAVDVDAGGSAVKLRRVAVGAAREWVLYGGPTDPQIAAPAAGDLITALTQPRAAKEVLTAPNDVAFAPPEVKATVKLWYDGTEPAKEEKKDDKKDEKKDKPALPPEPKLKTGDPAVTLIFGKTEGDIVYVRRRTAAGQTDMKLPASVLGTVARGRLAYLNPAPKGFATNTATRVAFNRGAEQFELVKDEKPDPQYPTGKWTFAKPDRLKGQAADSIKVLNDILTPLATQTASQAAAEAPTPEQLKSFGLDPAAPVVRATVTLNTPDDKERVYLFGNETPDKQAVYAYQPGRKPIVFTVPKFVTDRLATADLRDLTLYRIDPAKVTAVRFYGWKQAAGKPVEYAFERKGKGWETKKSPAPFDADPAKLDALLAALAAPKPVRSTGMGQAPEHGFDLAGAKNALEIDLTVEGRPRPIVLNIGNETDDGQNYFVACSEKPDEIMVLPGFQFRPYKEKPDYLKR